LASLAALGAMALTRCGLPMDAADLWTAVERQPGDRVCRECEGLPGAAQEGIF